MGHVPHLLIPPPWDSDGLKLSADQAHHLNDVLRRTPGSPVSYTNGRGVIGVGTWQSGQVVRSGEHQVRLPEPHVHLFVAPPEAKERVRFLVEKATEMGVGRITWLRTEFGRGRPPRIDKARAWTVSGLEQSRGAWLTEVAEEQANVSDLPEGTVFTDRGGEHRPTGPEVFLAVGPEGGWASGEIPDRAARMGLGERVLRVETAALVASVVALRI